MEMNTDARELHKLEDDLQVEILPGTEIMTDVGDRHFIKGNTSSHQVLVPQPSDDPHDPLNWSPFWKSCVITAATWATFTQTLGPLALAPMFEFYVHDFNCTLAEAVQFSGVSILVLGFSNFVWVPISTAFGRRPAYLFSQLINIGSAIWRAKAQSYGSFMGACVLNGFASGPGESIQPAVITDMFFLHDRGKWNTFYFVFYIASLAVGPIFSGSMALHVGWRSFWWLYTAMLVSSFLMIAFMFPETRYHRKTAIATMTPEEETSGHEEKVQPVTSDESLHDTGASTVDPWLGKGGPSRAQWGLYTPNPNWAKALLMDVWIPWKMFAFPIVEFSSFVVSWSCSCFLTLNLTQVQVFAAPPYNLDPQTIGFFNFAVLIGLLIGLATAGPLSDWISMRATRKNNGVREPEMRLPTMIPFVIIMIFGNFMAAFGYQNKWPWPAIVVLGYGAAGLQAAALPSIASTYAVDSYKPVAGALFVSITVNKNVWGYGLSKFITEWTEEDGFVPAIMTNMCLTTLWCLFGILFYYKGKTFRRWTKNDKVHHM